MSGLPRGVTAGEREIDGVRTEVLQAAGNRSDQTVVHFHGGGYCTGSARTARTWAAHVTARTGCDVLLPEYRLAPEHRYPAALDDARAIIKALLGTLDPAKLVLSGDSAGGGLALAVLLAMRDEGADLPAGCILLSPWLDLSADRRAHPDLVRSEVLLSPDWLHACATAYTDPPRWTEPAVSPLFGSAAGLPPLLIQAGADELLAPDAAHLAATASAAGVTVSYTSWPRMWHDFALQPDILAAARDALAQQAWFIRTHNGRGISRPA